MSRPVRSLRSLTSSTVLPTPVQRAVDRSAPLRRTTGAAYDRTRRAAAPAWTTVTPAGRAVLVMVVVAWLLAWRLGWQEMAIVAAAGLVLTVVAALFMLGTTRIDVRMTAEPQRVTAGDSVTGEVEVANRGRVPMLPLVVELPVGGGGIAFALPPLRSGATHSELFVVPTERRGVIAVGPVTTVRGDAAGLFRRELSWSQATEVFVHPRVTPLEPLAAGLVRDLEGRTAQNVSMSDLAFHALREYTPGDDLRHVHWRSSARHGTLLVRQFLDTRRSHVMAVVDTRAEGYADVEDFELAVSVGASLVQRALLDGFDGSFVAGAHAMTRGVGRGALDVCARAELSEHSLVGSAARAAQLAPDTSFVMLVTGPHTDFLSLQRAASHFPVDVGAVVVRVDPGATPGMRTSGDLRVLTLSALADLPPLLAWGT